MHSSTDTESQPAGIVPCYITVNSRAVDQATIKILELFGQRSQYISIKFSLHKPSENSWVCLLFRDSLRLASLRYIIGRRNCHLKSNQYNVHCKVILRGKGCPGAQLNRDRELSTAPVQPSQQDMFDLAHYWMDPQFTTCTIFP